MKNDLNQLLLFALLTPTSFSPEQKMNLLLGLAEKFGLEIALKNKKKGKKK